MSVFRVTRCVKSLTQRLPSQLSATVTVIQNNQPLLRTSLQYLRLFSTEQTRSEAETSTNANNDSEQSEETAEEEIDEFQDLDIDPNALSPREEAARDFRKARDTEFRPVHDSEFPYKPLPRMPGPSPSINAGFKRKRKYYSIAPIEMPLSSLQPLGGMPQCWVYNSNGGKLSVQTLSPDVFGQEARLDILYHCLKFEADRERGWTWNIVRNRGEVRGSGKKKAPQKGRGRARVGDAKCGIFRGGGKAHGRRPLNHETQLNQKVHNLGYKVSLSVRFAEGDLHVWDEFKLPRLDQPRQMRENVRKLREFHENGGNLAEMTENDVVQRLGLDEEFINKHPELPNLVPVFELDWNESTKLYGNVARCKQMLRKWEWLGRFEYERVKDRGTYEMVVEAKKSGNVIDMLEAMPIADFGWEFLKEEDEVNIMTVPTILMIYDEYVDPEFVDTMERVVGAELISVDELFGKEKGVFKLLKYKKIVLDTKALQKITDMISIESEVKRWNYYAKLIKTEQDETLRDAFPAHNDRSERYFGSQNANMSS